MTSPGHLSLSSRVTRMVVMPDSNACDSLLHFKELTSFIFVVLYPPVHRYPQSNLRRAIVGGIRPVCSMLIKSEQILCGLCGFFT